MCGVVQCGQDEGLSAYRDVRTAIPCKVPLPRHFLDVTAAGWALLGIRCIRSVVNFHLLGVNRTQFSLRNRNTYKRSFLHKTLFLNCQ